MADLLDAVSDFCSSEQFIFVHPSLKPDAEIVLTEWCKRIHGGATMESIENSLKEIAMLDLSLEIRKRFPELLKSFFSYLISTGQFPQAKQWTEWTELAERDYAAGFREDGTIKGKTFEKKYTDVGRNDPCPCGSGKKFKKCCMGLIA